MNKKLLLICMLAVFLISPVFASAYIYANSYYTPYGRTGYGPYYGSSYYYQPYYSSYYYQPYYSSFYTGGYNRNYGTFGFNYGGDPYFKYAVLDYFVRSSPARNRGFLY